ncbi:MAG: DUF3376 domain-containing protein, partial [Alphaproteobacteria bacterium]
PPEDAESGSRRRDLDRAKAALAEVAFGYEALLRDVDAVAAQIRSSIGDRTADIDRLIDTLHFDPSQAIGRFATELQAVYDTLAGSFAETCNLLGGRIAGAIAGLPETSRDAAAIDFATFPLVDRQVLPLMDAAQVDDLFAVRVMRISPHDSQLLADHRAPLMSRELGAFRGFLDRPARENDLLWGRLDAIERITQLVFNAVSADPGVRAQLEPLRRELTIEAMRAAIAEEAARPNTTVGPTAAKIERALAALA